MPKTRNGGDGIGKDVPTKDRERLQGGDYAPEGLRGGRPDLEDTGSGRAAPKPEDVAAGGVPSASPLDGTDAPDKGNLA